MPSAAYSVHSVTAITMRIDESNSRNEDWNLTQLLRQVLSKCEHSVMEHLQLGRYFSGYVEIASDMVSLHKDDVLESIQVNEIKLINTRANREVLLSFFRVCTLHRVMLVICNNGITAHTNHRFR